jgi:outer membrane immunogenic protein
MRTIFMAAVASLVTGGAAVAADLQAPPLVARPPAPPSWSGLYLGVNAGGGLGNGRSDFSVVGIGPFASVNNSLQGAIGGGQIGYNLQSGPFVYGVETDFQGSGVRGSLTAPGCSAAVCGIPLSATYSEKVPWFGTARARIGYGPSDWLIYATGGYAYARVSTDASATAGPATAAFSMKETRSGWTVGGGIEVALTHNWSAKVEYLYMDFGRHSTNWALAGLPIAINDSSLVTLNVVRGGVNFKF